ncbi:MAG: hypothetical protein ACP5RH_01135 [Leptodesmis sp.]|uniref:hypothetical protein n=1 Tax=Leptodesmis sp. TaxID=3100501 RepID=UPI003D121755
MTDKTTSGVGRKKIQLSERDLEQIEVMAGFGLQEDRIARVIGISPKTLQRRKKEMELLQEAIERGRAKAEVAIGRSLYNLAVVDQNISAIIWYEKTRCGRSERSQIEVVKAVESQIDEMLNRLQAVMKSDEYANLLNYLASIETGETTDTTE